MKEFFSFRDSVRNESILTMEHKYETEVWLPHPIARVFAFFADAKNLNLITPPWLHFRILSQSTPQIQAGTLLEYSIRIKMIAVRWQTLIESWNPTYQFVDTQLKGPYKLWHHTHSFTEQKGGTLMRDTVRYILPFGRLGEWIAGPMTHRDVKRIFEYRKEVIQKLSF